MFHKAIVELQKIRKFVDHRTLENEDNMLLSNQLENISYELTIVIQDMVRLDKSVFNLRKDNNEN